MNRCLFFKLYSALCSFGFVQSYADYSLFTFHIDDVYLCVLIYVNDLLITGNSIQVINKFKVHLNCTFSHERFENLKIFFWD